MTFEFTFWLLLFLKLGEERPRPRPVVRRIVLICHKPPFCAVRCGETPPPVGTKPCPPLR